MFAATIAATASVGADIGVRVVVPVSLFGAFGLWLTTRAHQLRTNHRAATARQRLEETMAALNRRIDRVGSEIDGLDEAQGRRARAMAERVEEVWDRTSFMRRLIDEDRGRLQKLETDIASRTWANTQMIRKGLRLHRAELDELASFAGPNLAMEEEIAAVTDAHPVLSIAVPGYNRPELLEQCLESVVSEVDATGTDRVELWVTDDRSTRKSAIEIARDYATRYPYIGFRLNSENIGLESNLIEACQPCRGTYLLILGNDDKLYPGALSRILEDIDREDHDLVVYSKVRIDQMDNELSKPAVGTTPADAGPGDTREYSDMLAFARSTGLLSGYGFISVVLMRRKRFLAVDGDKYLGLTMYPQVGRMLEAFGQAPMSFRNYPIVYHRTTARSEKLAEAAGRPEESFMFGGKDRDMRWFGPTLAALLMRICDTTSLTPDDFADVPERLFGQEQLIAWIRRNALLAKEHRIEFADDVSNDAERFLAALPASELSASNDDPADGQASDGGDSEQSDTAGETTRTEPTKMRHSSDAERSTASSRHQPALDTRYVTVTRVELETLVARVEALEEALDAMATET